MGDLIRDIGLQVLVGLSLLLFAWRARLAFDQRRWGRMCFCVAFAWLLLRSLLIRLAGGPVQGVAAQDPEFAVFLSSPPVYVFTVLFGLIGLCWVTWDENQEERRLARLRRQNDQRKQTIEERDATIAERDTTIETRDGTIGDRDSELKDAHQGRGFNRRQGDRNRRHLPGS